MQNSGKPCRGNARVCLMHFVAPHRDAQKNEFAVFQLRESGAIGPVSDPQNRNWQLRLTR